MSDQLAISGNLLDVMSSRDENASDFIMDMDCLYGTFILGDSEFAFHIRDMQEVVNYPDHVSKLPLMPDYVSGVFNLRETIVPLVDLKEVLKIESSVSTSDAYVAIVKCKGQLVGVVIDKTGDVLTIEEDEIARVQKRNESESAMVDGIANLNGGKRIIRVVTSERLVQLEDMPILDQKRSEAKIEEDVATVAGVSAGIGQTAITFFSGGTEFAIPVDEILEVLEKPGLENCHVSYDNCLGILNLRGTLISVVDFRVAMGGEGQTDLDTGMVIIVIADGKYCGFLVDAITDVLSYEDRGVIPIPELKDNFRKGCMKGVFPINETRNVFLLDAQRLCSEKDIAQLIEANTVPDALASSTDSKSLTSIHGAGTTGSGDDLKVFITFNLGRTLAVEILEVHEIIAFPDELMEPPGYDGFIRGMHNLRGSVIPFIDLRKFYGLGEYSNIKDASVLIVNRNDRLYGLIVDSVEDSLDIYSSQTTVIPKVMNDNSNKEYKGDVSRILEYKNFEGETNTLMVYSIDSLLSRLTGKVA